MRSTSSHRHRTGLVLTAGLGLLLVASPALAETTDAILDSLQATAFQYFWNEANPSNGLVRDRSTSGSPCSIAATGFGLSAICIGVDHGWVSRGDAQARVLTTLQTFWNGPQGSSVAGTIGYKGLFWHYLDMNTATRTWDSELSTIDSALLFAGILDAKEYFTSLDPTDALIRNLADSLYYRADWKFMENVGVPIYMGYKPGTGFANFGFWFGYNEAMILYILGLGSPTHPVNPNAWNAWMSGYKWNTWYGQTYIEFAPLFGHQYSHCWIDFRNINDAFNQSHGLTYFENSRRATLAQQAYAIANPLNFVGYSDSLWGLTASDIPGGYSARGAPPGQNDDGTITFMVPIGSIAFAPEIVLPTIRNMYNTYKTQLWGRYGFRDAFNLTVNWWDTDVIGIDQGPIIMMIENYRTQGVWRRFMQNPHIYNGLAAAHFVFSPDGAESVTPRAVALEQNAPNPFSSATTIRFQLARAGHIELSLFDIAGREVARLVDGERPAGSHEVTLDGRQLASGVYLYRLTTHEGRALKRCVLIR